MPSSAYLALKRCVDIVGGLLLLILLAPVIIVVGCIIVLTSSGPAFYTQVRLGRFGKPFVIWKLRTMEHNAEGRSGPKWSTPGDSRVTPIGRILRRLHIDEFPQLWNVLRGEMSLVGPRPERPEFFPVLSAAISNYGDRLLVKPGVTGMAQVYLPPDEDVSGVRRKQKFDVFYIAAIGFWLDLRLMLATVLQAVGVPHSIVRPGLWLPHMDQIEMPEAPLEVSPKPHRSSTHLVTVPPASPTAS